MRFFFSVVVILLAYSANSQIWLDNTCPIERNITSEDYTSAKANNLLTLIVNQEGKVLMNGKKQEEMSEIAFKEAVYNFLTNPSEENTKADAPKRAIIAIGSYGEHDYYELILRYVREVYLYAWDEASKQKYNSSYMSLNCKKRKKIRNAEFLYNVIQLNTQEPEDNKKPSISPGVPTFDGDVSDN